MCCLSILFLSTPAARKSARVCIRVSQTGPCRLRPPSGSAHFSNGVLHVIPLLLSVRIPKSQGARPNPLSQSHKRQAAKVSLAFAKTAYPSRPTPAEYMVATLWTVTPGAPWGCPLGHRLLRRPFLLLCGLAAKRGPVFSQCSSSSSLITPLSKPLVPQGLASLPQRVYTPLQRCFSLRSAHLTQHHGGRYP